MIRMRTILSALVLSSLGFWGCKASAMPIGDLQPAAEPVGDPGEVLPGAEISPDTLNDGPHVYWMGESEALVFYYCDGSFEMRRAEVPGIGSIPGFCDDTGMSYRIARRAPREGSEVEDGLSRIFAVSDIHGEYEALVSLLINAGVIDDELHWSWGNGRLVVLGDVFDRGDRVTECLWLIHALEREAEEAGGRVHYTLGNHELMILQGDLRYVNTKYTEGIVSATGIKYEDLFGPDMEFGRWLRSKHTVIKLNDILFVHAGIGPGLVDRGLSLRDINETVRDGIDLRSYEFVFKDLPGALYQADGPLWYRGFYQGQDGWYGRATAEDVRSLLDYFGAETAVVGHTEVRGDIRPLFDGLVIGIDVSLENLGSFEGLLWEDGTFYRVRGDGAREPLMGS